MISILIAIMLVNICFDVAHFIASCLSFIIYPVLFLYHIGHSTYESLRITKTAKNELSTQLAAVTEQRDSLLQQLVELRAGMAYAKEIEIMQLSTYLYKNVHTVAVAQVMVKHCTESEHYFLINAGTSKGVMPDMVVVCNRMLIGRVVEAYPWYSKVLLMSDKQSKISVFVGEETVTAIYKGQNNEKEGELIFVNSPEQVIDQELVISSGQGMIFPYGFAIGTVNKQKDGQTKVSFFSDMKDIRYCSVVTKQK